VLDRREAIRAAVKACRRGDLLLIAGKGHETTQVIAAPQHPSGVIKIHFDDREVAREALDT
jgi:UDP-N-acetylmuramoyl-L-alanyl-D-glutamate--2,6-diaminopimelate ligase